MKHLLIFLVCSLLVNSMTADNLFGDGEMTREQNRWRVWPTTAFSGQCETAGKGSCLLCSPAEAGDDISAISEIPPGQSCRCASAAEADGILP